MTAILNIGSRPTSDKNDSVMFKSGMVKEMEVNLEIVASSLSVHSKVISTSGLVTAILNPGSQPTSVNDGSVRNVSSMVANVWVAVGIVSPAHCF